jgi:hypothetical protein
LPNFIALIRINVSCSVGPLYLLSLAVIICISYQLKDQRGNEYPAAGSCLDNFSYLLLFVCQLGCDNEIEILWTATVSLEA